MSRFTETVEQREAGVGLFESTSNLYHLASETENMSEILELTLLALNKDLEALSMIREATLKNKHEVEKLKSCWEKELRIFEAETLQMHH
jgi:hypothetical protein